MIKNIEDLKNIQTVCRNQNQVKDCLNYLEQLGFDIDDFSAYYYDGYNIIFWEERDKRFIISNKLKENLKIEFYNKELVKTLQKFIKQKEEQEKEKKEKIKDIEVAKDGRITKVNNYKSKEKVFIGCEWDYREQTSWDTIEDFKSEFLDYLLKYGLAFSTKEARDRALFKIEIETRLKNIAERLNSGRKINWEDRNQAKFSIYYDYDEKIFYCCLRYSDDWQGAVYCLDKRFLEIAKQEIGEENLIKYFKE